MSCEADIIKSWLRGLFKTIENAEAVEVNEFDFGPLEEKEKKKQYHQYKSLTVLRQVNVSINVMNTEKEYNLVVKVLPTDDKERYSIKHKFKQLLRFSKEVQVYMEIIRPMFSLCSEMSPHLSFPSPPIAEVFLGQIDALNDCLVMENISHSGFVKYKQKIEDTEDNKSEKSDKRSDNDKSVAELISHCNIVLQNIAKFHALSLVISRLEGQALSEIFPFAVEGEGFRQEFKHRILPLREKILEYAMWSQAVMKEEADKQHLEAVIDKRIQELFWMLLDKRSRPTDAEKEVLVHGNLNFSTIMFRYEKNEPSDCKFLNLSHVSVSSPVMDIINFLFTTIGKNIINTFHLSFLLTYHSHLVEFCQELGVTEGIISLEELLKEFEEKKMFGMIMSCKVMMGEKILNLDEHKNDDLSFNISADKVSLYLESLAEACNCPSHSLEKRTYAHIRIFDKASPDKKKEGAFVSFIKSSSHSPRLRNIL